jgi:glycerol-3-phosphate acyltransferase PlsY
MFEYTWILAAYALGSLPFGLVLTRLAGAGDIRLIGSGNIGATNVMRTGRKGLAIVTLLLDVLKGWLAVFLVQHYAPHLAHYAALAAVIGHNFPFWLKFKGGKGVATSLGVVLAIHPLIAGALIASWLITFACVRISSVAALVAGLCAPLFGFLIGNSSDFLLLLALGAMLVLRHRSNIRRLIHGEESIARLRAERMKDNGTIASAPPAKENDSLPRAS